MKELENRDLVEYSSLQQLRIARPPLIGVAKTPVSLNYTQININE